MNRFLAPVVSVAALVLALAGTSDARVPAALRRSRSEAGRAVELDVTVTGTLCPAAMPAAASGRPVGPATQALPSRPPALLFGPAVGRQSSCPTLASRRATYVITAQPPSRAPPIAA